MSVTMAGPHGPGGFPRTPRRPSRHDEKHISNQNWKQMAVCLSPTCVCPLGHDSCHPQSCGVAMFWPDLGSRSPLMAISEVNMGTTTSDLALGGGLDPRSGPKCGTAPHTMPLMWGTSTQKPSVGRPKHCHPTALRMTCICDYVPNPNL
jgi:hypothetical protein